MVFSSQRFFPRFCFFSSVLNSSSHFTVCFLSRQEGRLRFSQTISFCFVHWSWRSCFNVLFDNHFELRYVIPEPNTLLSSKLFNLFKGSDENSFQGILRFWTKTSYLNSISPFWENCSMQMNSVTCRKL